MLSLPNILTLSRILTVPILLALLWPGAREGTHQPAPRPPIPPFETLAPMETEGRNAWLQRYELRLVVLRRPR